jgi:putative aldouronate transport system substrate-binding protein
MKKLLAILVTMAMLVTISSFAVAEGNFVDGRFTEPVTITVQHMNRSTEGWDINNNAFLDYIRNGMLETYNINVEFVESVRWGEEDIVAPNLAAGTTADVSMTYNDGAVQTYFEQGAVLDLTPYLEEYADLIPNLTDFLGTYLTWKLDPYTNELAMIPARRMNVARINTFVRQDWLDMLGLEVPTTMQEFEDMLIAFRDNADTLLGDEASMMIPFSMTDDVGWRANNILTSFIPAEQLNDVNNYLYNDERQFLMPGIKEGVRLLNKWFNEGLILQDFSLYTIGDKTEENLIKAGYVGAIETNWDDPYRNGEESVQYMLQQQRGDDAVLAVIDPFPNDTGITTKVNYSAPGIWIYMPATNTEPLASLLYLNWMATFENRYFLQTGVEGQNYTYNDDGVLVAQIPSDPFYTMSSSNNSDTAFIINGLDLGSAEATAATMALGYANIDPELIKVAYATALQNGVSFGNINLGTIDAEQGIKEALGEKRDIILNTAVNASVEDFDAVWDAGMEDYLASGGQAVMDERMAKYEAAFGE